MFRRDWFKALAAGVAALSGVRTTANVIAPRGAFKPESFDGRKGGDLPDGYYPCKAIDAATGEEVRFVFCWNADTQIIGRYYSEDSDGLQFVLDESGNPRCIWETRPIWLVPVKMLERMEG